MHKGAAALLWGESAHDAGQRLLLAAQRAVGVGGTRPPRLSPGGGNGKGGVPIPCCRRPFSDPADGVWNLPRIVAHSALPSAVQSHLDTVSPQHLEVVERLFPAL